MYERLVVKASCLTRKWDDTLGKEICTRILVYEMVVQKQLEKTVEVQVAK